MLYALFNNHELIGLFDSYDSAFIFVKGLEKNSLINKKDYTLKEYHTNSILYERDISLNTKDDQTNLYEYNTFLKEVDNIKINRKSTNRKLTDADIEKKKEIRKKKAELDKEIFLLEEQKDKITIKKNEYEYNIKLYNQLKKDKKNKEDFIIPILFKYKYELIKQLENENKLNFKNYNELYVPEELNTSYQALFTSV